jgi:8-oxo-dGTP pyrophosphatase MutT (NUDIX family)
MENELIGNWKRIKRTSKYDNNWISVFHDDVINPNGGKGIYGVVHFKNLAIGIIPVDVHGNTWLVGQHRYPQNKYSWEIPEGGGPLNIDPLLSAKRELQEEVGLAAKTWELILEMDLSNSVSDERALIYIATDVYEVPKMPEETEDLQLRQLSLKEAYKMVLSGEITDSLSVAGILKAAVILGINS